jgi:hypothetical protein
MSELGEARPWTDPTINRTTIRAVDSPMIGVADSRTEQQPAEDVSLDAQVSELFASGWTDVVVARHSKIVKPSRLFGRVYVDQNPTGSLAPAVTVRLLIKSPPTPPE